MDGAGTGRGGPKQQRLLRTKQDVHMHIYSDKQKKCAQLLKPRHFDNATIGLSILGPTGLELFPAP